MKKSAFLLRAAMFVAAFVHGFPATKHGRLFLAHPSLDEGWKAAGSLFAIFLYLLPPRTIGRFVVSVWRSHRVLLVGAGWLLALVHSVPALDHLPRLFVTPSWADGWRGVASLVAVLWFVAPIEAQRAIVALLHRFTLRGNYMEPQSPMESSCTSNTSMPVGRPAPGVSP